MVPVAPFVELTDVEAMGLSVAQGLELIEAFYWDLNDAIRAWSKRCGAVMGARMPTENQASVYSVTLAYLRTIRSARTVEGETVVEASRRSPINDTLFGLVRIRPNGRAIQDLYRFRVKGPAISRGKYDVHIYVSTVSVAEAFRPLNAGSCRLVQ